MSTLKRLLHLATTTRRDASAQEPPEHRAVSPFGADVLVLPEEVPFLLASARLAPEPALPSQVVTSYRAHLGGLRRTA